MNMYGTRFTIRCAAVALACMCGAGASAAVTAPAPTDTVAEAVGTVFGTYVRGSLDNLLSLGVEVDHAAFMRALDAAVQGRRGMFDAADANAYLTRYIDSLRPATARVDTLSVESQKAFVDSVAALPGAVTTPSGLVFIVEREGEGAMPVDSDTVEVTYEGRFFDGVRFDATDRPVAFNVRDLTPGFSEGLKLMRPGGRYRLVFPAALGYGEQGIPGAIPGNAALDFTVDLISINPTK